MPSGINWDKIGREERARRNGTVRIREINERYWRRKKRRKRAGKTNAAPKANTAPFHSSNKPKNVMSKEMEDKLIKQIQSSARQQNNILREKNIRRKSMGIGAKDSLWVAEHEEPFNYADLLGRFWEFNQHGIAAFSWKRISRVVIAKQCEYFCLGFPAIIVDRLRQQIENQKNQAGLPISQIEKKIIETLSNISNRHKWTYMPGGILRQIFLINRKALNRAAELNPALFSYL